MITEITLVLMVLAILAGLLHLINLMKSRAFLEQHDDTHLLFIIATVFFIVSITLFGVYTILTTPYGTYLTGITQNMILAAYALFAFPLGVLALLAALFSLE